MSTATATSNGGDPLKGFRKAADDAKQVGSTMNILKEYLPTSWQTGGPASSSLPTAFTDPRHTKTDSGKSTGGGGGAFFSGSWPQWSSANPDEWWDTLGMTRFQRWTCAVVMIAAAALLFGLALMRLPLVALRPRKFITPLCVGSLLCFLAAAPLQGFLGWARHLMSRDRMPYTLAYLASTVLTLWMAIGVQSALLTVPAAVLQGGCTLAYIISYVPGGSAGVSSIVSAARARFLNF